MEAAPAAPAPHTFFHFGEKTRLLAAPETRPENGPLGKGHPRLICVARSLLGRKTRGGGGAGTGAVGRGEPGMFLPGCEPEDASRGNRPRPAVASPGAGGSGRLRAGRRREGSGLTEPGEQGALRRACAVRPSHTTAAAATTPGRGGLRDACLGSGSAAGGKTRSGWGGADLTVWRKGPAPASSTGLEKLPSSPSRAPEAKARPRAKPCLRLPGPEDV